MEKAFPKVLVYINENIFSKEPKGGPFAVCYMYYNEMKRRGENTLSFLKGSYLERNNSSTKKMIRRLPKWFLSLERQIRMRKPLVNFLDNEPIDTGHDFSDYDIVHFHSTLDLYKEKKALDRFKGIVVLQSHSPQPLSQEVYAKLGCILKNTIFNFVERYSKVDKYAFCRADYIIFPCKEAEEPYFNNWDYFEQIYEKKKDKFKYVLTGINSVQAKRNRNEVLEELQIPNNDFVISYVGRHNQVKGYDILKDIAKIYFGIDKDSWFISAGKEEPIKRLNHTHWKEIGWTKDAQSYIAASDVFLLPNRETYFDIVMIEILSLGKIVVASRTGGNKYFEKQGVKGVFLYDTVEEAVELLTKIKHMTLVERDLLGRENYNFYRNNLTVSSMYDSYMKLLKEIYIDKN